MRDTEKLNPEDGDARNACQTLPQKVEKREMYPEEDSNGSISNETVIEKVQLTKNSLANGSSGILLFINK